MSTNLEVFFCDLCNESVPQTDIEAGKAIRIKGRVVGACCAAALVNRPDRASPRRAAGASGVLATGVVVLAGVAAAAAFLDWRLSNEHGALTGRLGLMEDGLQLQQDRLVKLEDAVTQVGARVNVDALVSRLDNVDARVDNARSSIELSVTRIEEALQAASDKERASLSEQRDALAALKAIVLNVAADVALLRALPSPVPKPIDSPPPASEAPVSASANAELPPEVKHQVMALADEDPGTRFSAVDKLLRSRDIKVLPALLPMAKDANTFVRRLTVEGLREFRRADVVETLLVALADPESIVRLTASASLRALTAQRIDFDDTNASTRSAAQRRWQDWWEKNRASFTF